MGAHGVPVSVTAVSQIKVMANRFRERTAHHGPGTMQILREKHGEDEAKTGGNEDGEYGQVETEEVDIGKIQIAAQHFLGKRRDKIEESIRSTMEGHQRQILGTLTVEELYKDRAAFSSRVRGHVYEDLQRMGFVLVSYVVQKIDDEMGYMAALGAKQTAKVKGDAAKGEAEHQSDARKRVAEFRAAADIASAEANRKAHVQVNMQSQAEAESDRDLNMKRNAYDREVNRTRAGADAATAIAEAQQQQMVTKETTQQKVEEAAILIEVTKRE